MIMIVPFGTNEHTVYKCKGLQVGSSPLMSFPPINLEVLDKQGWTLCYQYLGGRLLFALKAWTEYIQRLDRQSGKIPPAVFRRFTWRILNEVVHICGSHQSMPAYHFLKGVGQLSGHDRLQEGSASGIRGPQWPSCRRSNPSDA